MITGGLHPSPPTQKNETPRPRSRCFKGKGKRRPEGRLKLTGILQAVFVLCQVGGDTFFRRRHAGLARSPTGGADLAAFLKESHGVEETQDLIHVATEWQVVDHLHHDHAILPNQEGATQSESGLLVKNIVSVGHRTILIAEERVLDRADATLVDGRVAPVGVGFCVVDGDTQDLGAALLEFTDTVVKSDQFRRSHEGEILGVEEEDDILALVVRQGNLLGRSIFHDRGSREIGRGFVDEDCHGSLWDWGRAEPGIAHSRWGLGNLNLPTDSWLLSTMA